MICKARDNSRPSLKRKTIWSPKFKHNWTTKRHMQAQTCRTWFQGQAWITVMLFQAPMGTQHLKHAREHDHKKPNISSNQILPFVFAEQNRYPIQ